MTSPGIGLQQPPRPPRARAASGAVCGPARGRRLTGALAALLLVPALAAAEGLVPSSEMPGQLREVGFAQRLGEPVPRELRFRDAGGRSVRLGELLGERPAILVPVYFDCPMLCGMVLNGLVTTLKTLDLDPGDDFEVIVFSFDPRETPAQAATRRDAALARYGRPGLEAGWHFLVGEQQSVEALTEAIGFRASYDAPRDEFAHAAGLVILTPEGRIARTVYGVEYAPRDLRLALVEASAGAIGGLVDEVLLFCFHYDPAIGRYSAATMNLVRAGGAVTVVVLAGMVLGMVRRERRIANSESGMQSAPRPVGSEGGSPGGTAT